MKCELRDNIITAEGDAVSELYDRGFYGRVKDGRLELALVEGAYLLYRKKIEVLLNGESVDFKTFFEIASRRITDFELGYIVFKDLRERGYYTKMSPIGFRLYPRGGHPGKTAAHIFVYLISERSHLPLQRMIRELNRAENARKRLILAIVDEESDITFYELKTAVMTGGDSKPDEIETPAEAGLIGDRTIVWDPKMADFLHSTYFFGKKLDEFRLQLSLVESGYLLARKWIKIGDLGVEAFDCYAAEIDLGYVLKYSAYSDLRDSGHVVKTGFKFGTHFRVYKKFKTDAHSEYLVHAVSTDHAFSLPELSRAVRIANSVHKRMIFGYPDCDGDRVGYLEIAWIRL
ncbi:MAG: tRNA-intron lyase [Euryarchaeota archaeon]|nr:MAG: tRNA-splicing endonuclease [ANME-2 cluster archaeon]MEA1864893.1 tRNA-intron lyase [Euryarchaeota archaeon]